MTITETQTRAELIDAQLGASGWNVKDPTQVVEEFDNLTILLEGVAEPRTKKMKAISKTPVVSKPSTAH